jgi:hypothetical protein
MHHVMAWRVVAATVLLIGCSEPIGLGASGAGESTSTVEIARRKPVPGLPDSVRIPPSPIPPIFVELPPVEDRP